MARFLILLMCVMASLCMPIVMPMVPAIYNIHHPQCGETQYNSTQQFTDILEQVSSDLAPPTFQKDCGYIDILFAENPQLKAIYENSTFIVQTFA